MGICSSYPVVPADRRERHKDKDEGKSVIIDDWGFLHTQSDSDDDDNSDSDSHIKLDSSFADIPKGHFIHFDTKYSLFYQHTENNNFHSPPIFESLDIEKQKVKHQSNPKKSKNKIVSDVNNPSSDSLSRTLYSLLYHKCQLKERFSLPNPLIQNGENDIISLSRFDMWKILLQRNDSNSEFQNGTENSQKRRIIEDKISNIQLYDENNNGSEKKNENIYLNPFPLSLLRQVFVDVPRTFPSHSLLCKQENKNYLYQIIIYLCTNHHIHKQTANLKANNCDEKDQNNDDVNDNEKIFSTSRLLSSENFGDFLYLQGINYLIGMIFIISNGNIYETQWMAKHFLYTLHGHLLFQDSPLSSQSLSFSSHYKDSHFDFLTIRRCFDFFTFLISSTPKYQNVNSLLQSAEITVEMFSIPYFISFGFYNLPFAYCCQIMDITLILRGTKKMEKQEDPSDSITFIPPLLHFMMRFLITFLSFTHEKFQRERVEMSLENVFPFLLRPVRTKRENENQKYKNQMKKFTRKQFDEICWKSLPSALFNEENSNHKQCESNKDKDNESDVFSHQLIQWKEMKRREKSS